MPNFKKSGRIIDAALLSVDDFFVANYHNKLRFARVSEINKGVIRAEVYDSNGNKAGYRSFTIKELSIAGREQMVEVVE